MLYTQTVTGAALDLLKELTSLPELSQFGLVGGTNLSLRLGHRTSVDLDMFTNKYFDSEWIYNYLEARFCAYFAGLARRFDALYIYR